MLSNFICTDNKKENYGATVNGIISHSHPSLFPQKGQLQSQ